MDRSQSAHSLVLLTSVVVALSSDGAPRLIAALAAVMAGAAGVLREVRTHRA